MCRNRSCTVISREGSTRAQACRPPFSRRRPSSWRHFRQIFRNGIADLHPSFLDQHHGGDGNDRLGHGIDAENRIRAALDPSRRGRETPSSCTTLSFRAAPPASPRPAPCRLRCASALRPRSARVELDDRPTSSGFAAVRQGPARPRRFQSLQLRTMPMRRGRDGDGSSLPPVFYFGAIFAAAGRTTQAPIPVCSRRPAPSFLRRSNSGVLLRTLGLILDSLIG